MSILIPKAALRFLTTAILGVAFFILPVPSGGRITVPFDIAVGWVTRSLPSVVAVYCLALITVGAVGSIAATQHARPSWASAFVTSKTMLLLRLAGLPLAFMYMLGSDPT